MSTNSKFKEALVRAVQTPATSRDLSDSEKVSLLLRNDGMRASIEVALVLKRLGLSLRKAHEVIGRLAEGKEVAVEVSARDFTKFGAESLADHGVSAANIVVPQKPEVRQIRLSLGLSQSEFATRFGLELDTVRNWEQGRNEPDRAAVLLLHVIASNPEAVDHAIGHPPPPKRQASILTYLKRLRSSQHRAYVEGYALSSSHSPNADSGNSQDVERLIRKPENDKVLIRLRSDSSQGRTYLAGYVFSAWHSANAASGSSQDVERLIRKPEDDSVLIMGTYSHQRSDHGYVHAMLEIRGNAHESAGDSDGSFFASIPGIASERRFADRHADRGRAEPIQLSRTSRKRFGDSLQ